MPFFAAALLLAAAPPPQDGSAAWELDLLRRWHEYSAEVAQTEQDFRGDIVGGGLGEMGRLSFVFREAGVRRWPRRPLPSEDRQLANAAALGQPPADFERNLPAIVAYLRLSLVLEDAASVVRRWPLKRRFPCDATILQLTREMDAFRSRQKKELQQGRLDAAYALTREAVGRLADPGLRAQVLLARRERIRAYWREELLSLLWMLPLLAASGCAVAIFIRRRAKNGIPHMGIAGAEIES